MSDSAPPHPGVVTDAIDIHAREAQMFPRLSADMTARIAAYGTTEAVAKGTMLFRRGDRSVDFFLVLDGRIEVFETDAHGHPNVFTTHAANQFSGELDLFNDREVLVSGRTGADAGGYAEAAAAMDRAAAAMPGYLGIDSARGEDGVGITISWWRDEAAALAWRDDPDHARIRDQGRAVWYDWYRVVVATVDRAYGWARPTA